MFCLHVLPTARRLKAQSSLQRPRLLSPAGRFHHSTLSRFPGGCWEGPKSQPGKRGKMELLVTENRPEDRVGKIDFEHPGNRGKRGKMELLVTENRPRTGLEKSILNTLEIVESVEKWSSWSPKTSSRNGAVKPQHGKAGKAGLVSRSFVFPRFPRFPGCSKSILERSTNISCACYGGIPGGNKGGYPEGITSKDCFSRSAVCPRGPGLEAESNEVDGWSYARHP